MAVTIPATIVIVIIIIIIIIIVIVIPAIQQEVQCLCAVYGIDNVLGSPDEPGAFDRMLARDLGAHLVLERLQLIDG